MPLSHAELVKIAERWLRDVCRCSTVLTEWATPNLDERPDAIGWIVNCASVVVECKCSLADLYADRAKRFRHDDSGMGERRYYLFEDGLDIRPEHVAEDWGFGVLIYQPEIEQVKQVRQSRISPMAVNHRAEIATLIHALTLATRAAGKPVQEMRKSAPKVPKSKHPAIVQFVRDYGDGCTAKEIARDVLGNHKLSKHLANAIRAGEIAGLVAEGSPASIRLEP